MLKTGKWILTLGIVVAVPGLAAAGPFGIGVKGAKAAPVDNQRVAEEIAVGLRQAKMDQFDIDIEFQQGVCRLTGSIGTPAQKAQCSKVISSVNGVKRVDNLLVVQSAAQPNPAQSGNPFAPQQAVINAAYQQAPAAFPGVQQTSAVFPTQTAAAQTQAPAAAASGNQKVAEQVAQALSAARLEAYDVEIRQQNGVCTLKGTIGSEAQRVRAEQIAQSVPGVNGVRNLLKVVGGGAEQGPYGPVNAARYQPNPGQPPVAPNGAAPPVAPGARAPYGPGPAGPYGPAAAGPYAPGAGRYPAAPYPPGYGHPGSGASHMIHNQPNLPAHAFPTYAQYPNSAAISYPKQYSASAWPYIGPFYPYPQVPLGWRQAQLEWDDGYWKLNFRPRTDKWWWFLSPKNW